MRVLFFPLPLDIRENLEIDILSQDSRYDLARVNEMVEIMLDAICSQAPTIRINGADIPHEVVKSRFLKLDSSHIEYVLHAMDQCPSDIAFAMHFFSR